MKAAGTLTLTPVQRMRNANLRVLRIGLAAVSTAAVASGLGYFYLYAKPKYLKYKKYLE